MPFAISTSDIFHISSKENTDSVHRGEKSFIDTSFVFCFLFFFLVFGLFFVVVLVVFILTCYSVAGMESSELKHLR